MNNTESLNKIRQIIRNHIQIHGESPYKLNLDILTPIKNTMKFTEYYIIEYLGDYWAIEPSNYYIWTNTKDLLDYLESNEGWVDLLRFIRMEKLEIPDFGMAEIIRAMLRALYSVQLTDDDRNNLRNYVHNN